MRNVNGCARREWMGKDVYIKIQSRGLQNKNNTYW